MHKYSIVNAVHFKSDKRKEIMFCSKCGKEIPDNHAFCDKCGAPTAVPQTVCVQNAPANANGKKVGCGCAVIAFVAVMAIVGIATNAEKTTSENNTTNEQTHGAVEINKVEKTTAAATTPSVSKFDGDCGIHALAHMSSDIINHPQLKVALRNTTNKDIAAIKFLAVPYDVYGEEIKNSLFTQEYLYTDDLLPAGKKKTITYGPFILQNIKKVKLFVYSVYFEDGTEWGDKDATRSEILKSGRAIEATFEK